MKAGIVGKEIICGDEMREKDVVALTDETWLTDGKGRSGTAKKDGKGDRDEIPVEGGVEALDGFDIFVMCRGPAFRGLAVA